MAGDDAKADGHGRTGRQFEAMATLILTQAIKEARCGDLLTCLFEGGTATVEAGRGLVLIPGSVLVSLDADDARPS